MLARLALAVARRLSDERLAGLVDTVFVRTRRAFAAAIAVPRGAQEARLRMLLADNADTEIGRRYDFARLRDLDAYRAAVPICTWDDVAPMVERMIAGERKLLVAEDPFFYATTSGTTGRRKLLPVTARFVEECRVANKLLYQTTLKAMPQLLKGKRLSLRSPKTEPLGRGLEAGSITVALGGGFEDEEGLFDAVPVDVFFVPDFATRYFLALRFSLQERVTVASAVNPSTLVLFARTLAEHGAELAAALEQGSLGVDVPDEALRARLQGRARTDAAAAGRVRASMAAHGKARMKDAFPDLAGLVCWKGGSAPWYLAQLPASYGELATLDYGYCASEGCFGAPVGVEGAASVLVPHGHVIELAPEDELDAVRAGTRPTLLLDQAEVGRRYGVIVTTGAGLYRYDMNDIVEVTGHVGKAPLVVFRHKAGAMASLTGEKVGEAHVVDAMAKAGFHGAGFCAAPTLSPEGARWVIAVDPGEQAHVDLEELARRFEAGLCAANEEYDAKRKSMRLLPAQAVLLPAGAVVAHRAARVAAGAPDAHVKVPHVSPDGQLVLALGLERTAPDVAARLPCRAPAVGAEQRA
ncbi:MAG: GH3 auxin-responsive promoter family protein [Deltaproteobacteria bacterium]|nr:GH3 auxin-responsive promoter family protein [Deltaproteobacteria bacterium]